MAKILLPGAEADVGGSIKAHRGWLVDPTVGANVRLPNFGLSISIRAAKNICR